MQSLEKALLSQTILSYAKSGNMEEARQLFDTAKNPDLFLWNTMIRGYTYAELYEEAIAFYHNMFGAGLIANHFTFPFVIKSCTYLAASKEGLKVHARLFKCGLDSDLFIGSSLITMYSAFGLINNAQKMFDEMPVKDLVSWNSMIDGYVLNREGRKALSCFKDLPGSLGKRHDCCGIMSALAACSLEASFKSGREIHGYMIRNDLEKDMKVVTSLLDMYCKCKDMSSAEKVFNRIPLKTVVTWNSLIGGYSLNEQHASAISCLKKMLCENREPGTVTMVKLLPACAAMESVSVGKMIHAYSIRKGLLPHLYLETALTDMYGKCGKLRSAQLLFDRMFEKNLVSWSAMLAACVKNQEYRKAIDLFVKLLNESLEPDLYTTCAIMPAYTELASLKDGKQIHSYAVRMGFSDNLVVSNSIIYLYARCGDLKSSREVFDRIPQKDLV
ncbi:Pentatricopeptide repeat-containing protein [Rhynchospora pubera]|nr:Pentatricopeptide repeat-containing protein [Rhynchospora pubera]